MNVDVNFSGIVSMSGKETKLKWANIGNAALENIGTNFLFAAIKFQKRVNTTLN